MPCMDSIGTRQLLIFEDMSLLTNHQIRYQIPKIREQVEAAVMVAVTDILNEASGTPDHTNRYAWAEWANLNSQIAYIYFMWAVAMNPSVVESVEGDPSGESVSDSDIQFIVNANMDKVIAECVENPPAGFKPHGNP